METTLREFLNLVRINFTNVLQSLSDVAECVTLEGAYCGPKTSVNELGENEYLAYEFPETTAAWDDYLLSQAIQSMTEEEFREVVLECIYDLMDRNEATKKKEYEDDFLTDEMLEEELFENGAGI